MLGLCEAGLSKLLELMFRFETFKACHDQFHKIAVMRSLPSTITKHQFMTREMSTQTHFVTIDNKTLFSASQESQAV